MMLQFACLLLLSAAAHADQAGWDYFQKLHVRDESAADCNKEMTRLFPTKDVGCIQRHVFIISEPKPVEDVCSHAGREQAEVITSRTVFKLLECTLHAKHPECVYASAAVRGKIVTSCDSNTPAYLEDIAAQ